MLKNGRISSNLDSFTRLLLAGDEIGELRIGDLVKNAAACVDGCSIDDNFEIRNIQVTLSFDDLGLKRLDLIRDAADVGIIMALPQQAFVVLVDLVLHLILLQEVDRRARFRKFLIFFQAFYLIEGQDFFNRNFNQFLELGYFLSLICLLAS